MLVIYDFIGSSKAGIDVHPQQDLINRGITNVPRSFVAFGIGDFAIWEIEDNYDIAALPSYVTATERGSTNPVIQMYNCRRFNIKFVDPSDIPEDPRAPGRSVKCEFCGYTGHPVFHPSGGFGCPQCVRSEYLTFIPADESSGLLLSEITTSGGDSVDNENDKDEAETDRFLTALGTTYREELARKIAEDSAHAFELAGPGQDPGDVRDMVYLAALKVLSTE